MLKSLDLLGPMKWPSILAVTVVPVVSFLFWDGSEGARAMRVYGPGAVGPVVMTIGRDAATPPTPGSAIEWCARLCKDCGNRFDTLELAYDRDGAPGDFVAAQPVAGKLCAALDWPAGARFNGVTVRVISAGKPVAVRRWPLG